MRKRLPVICAAVLTLLASAACSKDPETPGPIVLVTVDTLRADHVGAYGYFRDTTPNIDLFAEKAVIFENTVSTIATTLPAHLSLMTSTLTTRHGIKGNSFVIDRQKLGDEGLKTMAELLGAAGYDTAAFVSAAPLKADSGIDAGFDFFNEPENKNRIARETADQVLEWLKKPPRDPFFLWVHFWDPHGPYNAPEGFIHTFDREKEQREHFRAKAIPWERRSIRKSNRYDEEILHADSQVQRIFEALEEMGVWDRATVIVTADHGEGLGQHGWFPHGRIHNEQIFIPLIVKFPAATGRGGGRVSTFASHIDVLPTLAAALDLPFGEAASRFQGIDLFGDEAERPRYLFSERVHRKPEWDDGLRYSLLNKEWKYLHATKAEDELYDMVRDRNETTNVIDENPEVARRMLAEIGRTLETDRRSGKRVDREKRLKELKALGYVQ